MSRSGEKMQEYFKQREQMDRRQEAVKDAARQILETCATLRLSWGEFEKAVELVKFTARMERDD